MKLYDLIIKDYIHAAHTTPCGPCVSMSYSDEDFCDSCTLLRESLAEYLYMQPETKDIPSNQFYIKSARHIYVASVLTSVLEP